MEPHLALLNEMCCVSVLQALIIAGICRKSRSGFGTEPPVTMLFLRENGAHFLVPLGGLHRGAEINRHHVYFTDRTLSIYCALVVRWACTQRWLSQSENGVSKSMTS